MTLLAIEQILGRATPAASEAGHQIGRSREGRPIEAWTIGRGPVAISLVAGCHADEPVGPEMLRRLVSYLASRDPDHPLLRDFRWSIVPHVNPDGEERNRVWSDVTLPTPHASGAHDAGFDVARYLRHVVRELPGDDIEFGFPRDPSDRGARPENRAVAAFLSGGAPFHLHGSFHGMGLAPGPWFLIEPAWIDRTRDLRRQLRRRVRSMGYPLFDVDRKGEKGFRRIDAGFATRPDSAAMRHHFRALGDEETAALFRPSSMEFVRGLGGDPLTIVSEMPLFLVPEPSRRDGELAFRTGSEERRRLHEALERRVRELSSERARSAIERLGIRPMPIGDQMRLQLAFLDAALAALADHPS